METTHHIYIYKYIYIHMGFLLKSACCGFLEICFCSFFCWCFVWGCDFFRHWYRWHRYLSAFNGRKPLHQGTTLPTWFELWSCSVDGSSFFIQDCSLKLLKPRSGCVLLFGRVVQYSNLTFKKHLHYFPWKPVGNVEHLQHFVLFSDFRCPIWKRVDF